MTEEQSITFFAMINDAIEIAEDDGTIALLEAVKFHEAQLIIDSERALPCGCDDPETCADRGPGCEAVPEMLQFHRWRCECGATADALCRWNGRAYEHHHGYPIGHVEMELVDPPKEDG